MDARLLEILRCPTTRQCLRPATADELARCPDPRPESGLIREDGTTLYPIKNQIPLLIPEAAIFLKKPL